MNTFGMWPGASSACPARASAGWVARKVEEHLQFEPAACEERPGRLNGGHVSSFEGPESRVESRVKSTCFAKDLPGAISSWTACWSIDIGIVNSRGRKGVMQDGAAHQAANSGSQKAKVVWTMWEYEGCADPCRQPCWRRCRATLAAASRMVAGGVARQARHAVDGGTFVCLG